MIPARLLLAVAGGGALGAMLRHLVSVGGSGPVELWLTLAVNVTGSALLAGLTLLPVVRRSRTWAAALGPGLLGGFTTLSATSAQGRALLADGDPAVATAYLLGTLGACWVAVVVVGRVAARPSEEER